MYNKIKYWNSRRDPNAQTGKNIANSQVKWIKKFLNESDNILDYGPGVLRLVDAYKGFKKINLYDISHLYKNIVEEKCKNNGILIENYVIDDSGKIMTPFVDNQFDVVICSEVFLHSPEDEIEDLIIELSRIGKKVIVTTWYEKGENISFGHVWTRPYKKILESNNLDIVHWEENLFNINKVGFIYCK
jgi:ubiquinone/menaquinone biosynthesis C-methylase UbiE